MLETHLMLEKLLASVTDTSELPTVYSIKHNVANQRIKCYRKTEPPVLVTRNYSVMEQTSWLKC
jgi:hypothetical protein